jgi:hypothetical protein
LTFGARRDIRTRTLLCQCAEPEIPLPVLIPVRLGWLNKTTAQCRLLGL